MKLTGLFGAFLVVATPLFAALQPGDFNPVCGKDNPVRRVDQCNDKPCTYVDLKGSYNGQKAGKY